MGFFFVCATCEKYCLVNEKARQIPRYIRHFSNKCFTSREDVKLNENKISQDWLRFNHKRVILIVPTSTNAAAIPPRAPSCRGLTGQDACEKSLFGKQEALCPDCGVIQPLGELVLAKLILQAIFICQQGRKGGKTLGRNSWSQEEIGYLDEGLSNIPVLRSDWTREPFSHKSSVCFRSSHRSIALLSQLKMLTEGFGSKRSKSTSSHVFAASSPYFPTKNKIQDLKNTYTHTVYVFLLC